MALGCIRRLASGCFVTGLKWCILLLTQPSMAMRTFAAILGLNGLLGLAVVFGVLAFLAFFFFFFFFFFGFSDAKYLG